MKKLLFVSLSGLGIYLVIFTACEKKQSINAVQLPISAPGDRRVAINQWIADAQMVADKSGIKKAHEIIDFIKVNGILVEPVLNGMKVLESSTSDNPFFIVSLSPDDENLGNPWKGLSNRYAAAAFFNPENRALVMKRAAELSPTWRGIIMLHEGYHAQAYLTEGYDWKNQQIFSKQERDTHTFENEVVAKLGGRLYVDLVTAYSYELEKREVEAKKKDPRAIVLLNRDLVEFDQVFGPPISKFERDLRNTQIWINAYFVLFERRFEASEASEKKAILLFSVYRANGILDAR